MYRLHLPGLLSYLRRRLGGDEQAAADVAQEAFVRIVGAERSYDATCVRGLLYRVARTVLIDHRRRQRVRERAHGAYAQLGTSGAAPAPDRELIGRDELARIERAILALPPRCQAVYVLHRFDGLTYGAIAAHCGISPSAVEKHMQKALRRLVAALDPPDMEQAGR